MDRPRNPGESRTDYDASGPLDWPPMENPFEEGDAAETFGAAGDGNDDDDQGAPFEPHSDPADMEAPSPTPPSRPELSAAATVQRLVWADRFARDLRAAAERQTIPLARVAKTVLEQRIWTLFGRARAEDYCCERLDNTARWLRRLGSLGRAFDLLPGLERAVAAEDGGPALGRTHASEVARVASPESVATWIRLARLLGTRDFTQAVRAARAAKSVWPIGSSDTIRAAMTILSDGPAPGALPTSSFSKDGSASVSAALRQAPPVRPADDVGAVASDPPGPHDPVSRCEVRLPVPGPMRVAFDEVRQLHSAVSGGEVPVADFIEALVAEAMNGPLPVDVDQVPLGRTRPTEAIERDLARENDDWGWLDTLEIPAPSDIRKTDRVFEKLHEDTLSLLRELKETSVDPHSGTPADLDRRLSQLVTIGDRIDRQLGRVLTYMGDKHAWLRLHFDSIEHYAAERLGMDRRPARDRTRATRLTKRLPLLRQAYENGTLGLQKTLLVTRALGPYIVPRAIERAWVEHAHRVTVQRMRDEARVAEREWLEHGSWTPRLPLTDQQWWDSLALHPGTNRRRIERLVGIPGSAAMRDTFTHLILRLPTPVADDFLAAVESRSSQLSQAWITRSADAAVEADEVPLMPLAMKAAEGFLSRGLPLPSWVGLLALLEEYLATWDPAKAPRRTRYGAIYGRDGYRCAAPGCTLRRNLEAHHVEPRAQGGGDEPENLTTLCRFHHQLGAHGALGACSGKAPLGLLWRLGREDVADWYRNDRRVMSPLDLMATA